MPRVRLKESSLTVPNFTPIVPATESAACSTVCSGLQPRPRIALDGDLTTSQRGPFCLAMAGNVRRGSGFALCSGASLQGKGQCLPLERYGQGEVVRNRAWGPCPGHLPNSRASPRSAEKSSFPASLAKRRAVWASVSGVVPPGKLSPPRGLAFLSPPPPQPPTFLPQKPYLQVGASAGEVAWSSIALKPDGSGFSSRFSLCGREALASSLKWASDACPTGPTGESTYDTSKSYLLSARHERNTFH